MLEALTLACHLSVCCDLRDWLASQAFGSEFPPYWSASGLLGSYGSFYLWVSIPGRTVLRKELVDMRWTAMSISSCILFQSLRIFHFNECSSLQILFGQNILKIFGHTDLLFSSIPLTSWIPKTLPLKSKDWWLLRFEFFHSFCDTAKAWFALGILCSTSFVKSPSFGILMSRCQMC